MTKKYKIYCVWANSSAFYWKTDEYKLKKGIIFNKFIFVKSYEFATLDYSIEKILKLKNDNAILEIDFKI